MMQFSQTGAYLIFTGILLFLLGLIQGALIPVVKNSRMALSGHTTAVQCGMALVIFGIIWPLVELPLILEMSAAIGSTVGFILIWLGITAASITGASKALPIAGSGYSAPARTETVVKILVRSGSTMSLFACALLAFGLMPMVF